MTENEKNLATALATVLKTYCSSLETKQPQIDTEYRRGIIMGWCQALQVGYGHRTADEICAAAESEAGCSIP